MNRVDIARLICYVGIAVFALGLYLGFSGISAPALGGTQDCGSAFQASDYADGAGSFVVAECDSKRSDRRTISIVFLALGGALVTGSLEGQRLVDREAAATGRS